MDEPIGLIFYYGFEKGEDSWRLEIQRLTSCNIRILLIQNFYWRRFLREESYRERTRRFLDVCAESNAKCLLTFTPSYTDYGVVGHRFGVFSESETEGIIEAAGKVSRHLKGYEALLGYYIDDEPPWRWDIDPKSWSRWREDFERRFKVSFPESLDGASERQKSSYMRWLLQKYIDYIRRFRMAVKNVNPDLKIAICYNPGAYRSGFIRTAGEVDLILVDLYPGWMGDPILYNRSVGFYAKINRDLLRRPFIFVLQAHRIILGHEPKPEEILKWSEEALREGASGLGWLASDFYGSEGNFRPTYHNSSERWSAVEKACREMKTYKPLNGDLAIIVPLESAYHGALDFDYLCYAYNFMRSLKVPFTFLGDYEVNGDMLLDYKVVVLAGQRYSTRNFRDSLEDYVRDGGVLVACMHDLSFDDSGDPLTEFLSDIFGVEGISELKHPDIRILITEGFGGLRGMREFLPGSGMAHLLTVKDDVRVLGRERSSNKPVIVSSKIGGGEAYYIGTNMFRASLHASIGWKWHVFFREIIDKTRYTSKFALEDPRS